MVGALEDEQVGPQWPALITALEGDKNVYVTMMNGTHIDSLGPETITRWLEFLDIYVADRVPVGLAHARRARSRSSMRSSTGGAPSVALPAVRFTNEPTVAAARAAFAAQDPRIRVLFDYGGGSLGPGALQAAFEGSLLDLAARRNRHDVLSRTGRHPCDDRVRGTGRPVQTGPLGQARHRPGVIGERLGRQASL